jgi:hypothetical protein
LPCIVVQHIDTTARRNSNGGGKADYGERIFEPELQQRMFADFRIGARRS